MKAPFYFTQNFAANPSILQYFVHWLMISKNPIKYLQMWKIYLTILLLVVPSLSLLGVDVSQHFSTSTYTCMKNNGYHYAIIRGYCSYGGVDANAI